LVLLLDAILCQMNLLVAGMLPKGCV